MARRRSLALLLVPVLLSSCEDCDGSESWDPTGIPEPERVEVVPREIYAAPGATFQLEARVLDRGRDVVDIRNYEQISIAWSAGTNIFPRNDENPVEVGLPNAPGTVISDVRATVRRVVSRPGGTEESRVVSDPATIRIAQGSAGNLPTDRIVVEHVPGFPPAAVLLDAKDGPNCIEDWTLAVVGTADLGRNLAGGCPPGTETAVFAVDREVEYQGPSAASPWTTGRDQEVRDPLPPRRFRSLPVMVGVDVDTGSVEAWGRQQIQEAAELLDRNRAGIGVEWVSHFEHGRQSVVVDPEAACGTASVDPMLPADLDITSDHILFILFVPGVGDEGKGWTCEPVPGRAGQVIFISWEEFAPSTLAHELGHAFSLLSPYLNFGNGHTNHLEGFTRANLMWSSSDFRLRINRTHLSVGQIYRMNFHPQSLLNRFLNPSQGIQRPCQPDLARGICPALAEDLGRAGSTP